MLPGLGCQSNQLFQLERLELVLDTDFLTRNHPIEFVTADLREVKTVGLKLEVR